MMRRVQFEDSEGRRWTTELPDGAPDEDAPRGIPVGPADLSPLMLPLALEVRLHNELHDRGILTMADAKRRAGEVEAAIRAALRLDVQSVMAAFLPLTEPSSPA